MKKLFRSPSSTLLLFGVLLILTLGFVASCGHQNQAPNEPQETQETFVLSKSNAEVQAVMAVQDRNNDALLARAGIEGVATGMTDAGRPAILILARDEAAAAALPARIDGVPVRALVTGEIRAIKGPPPGNNFDPTAKHRPAPNGVSLGHFNITAGTLGCLVTKNNTTYILSNNHVMADENHASIGDNILQPGPFDGGQNPGDRIAGLSDYVSIVFSTGANNVVDCAIAAVDNEADVTGETVSYGPPRSQTASASVNLRVMKYGRTTEDTNGRVQGINATVNVGYDSGVARFVNQIIIGGGGFSAGGDSGSLIVVRGGSDDRKPVGLLFAGGSGITVANPIDAVLNAFNVTVVGD